MGIVSPTLGARVDSGLEREGTQGVDEQHRRPGAPAGSAAFDLAVCAEMVLLDLPLVERVRRIAELGFQVEIWDWTRKDVGALARTGARFSSMTGYVTGALADPDGARELLRTAAQSVAVADQLGCPRLNLHGTGLDAKGLPVRPVHEVTGAMWLEAHRTLSQVADLGERAGVTFCLENLNTSVDHPGVPFARAADTLALVEAVGHPGLRMMLDLYHAQIGEGNLIELLRRAGPLIGEIQVADVPGRCEPGTGELNYPAIAAAIQEMGYRGTVGLEAWASGDSEHALERFRAAFTLPGRPPPAQAAAGQPAAPAPAPPPPPAAATPTGPGGTP
jgi:hydroxypyruvate isomerase